MRQVIRSGITIISILLFCNLTISAQKKASVKKVETTILPGSVNFNLRAWRDTSSSKQELTLYGCNTSVKIMVTDSVRYQIGTDTTYKKQESLTWGGLNQVFTGLPYGLQGSGENEYYISKYYMASPPIFPPKKTKNGKQLSQKVDIGLVIPDQFTFYGRKPVQLVNLDYAVLKPVYLNYVGVNYDYSHIVKKTSESKKSKLTKLASCNELKVDLVPLRIQCDDFGWVDTNSIQSGQGASGIARVRSNDAQVFLPSYEESISSCLDCEVTVLDDIIKDHEVFFALGDSIYKSISLTKFHADSTGKEINLFCRARQGGLPPGCKKNNGQDRRGYIFEE